MSVGNPHIGKSDFSGSISIWIHFIAFGALGILRHERHVGIEQQAEIGVFEQGQRIEPAKQGESCGNVEVDRIEFGDADAAGPRQPIEHRDRFAACGRDRP